VNAWSHISTPQYVFIALLVVSYGCENWSLWGRSQIADVDNRVLRAIFEPALGSHGTGPMFKTEGWQLVCPPVVIGEKNSPTVAHACRKGRLKWVLPQVGGWSTGQATLSLYKVVEALCSSGNEED
jgi:hypothetical protein